MKTSQKVYFQLSDTIMSLYQTYAIFLICLVFDYPKVFGNLSLFVSSLFSFRLYLFLFSFL